MLNLAVFSPRDIHHTFPKQAGHAMDDPHCFKRSQFKVPTWPLCAVNLIGMSFVDFESIKACIPLSTVGVVYVYGLMIMQMRDDILIQMQSDAMTKI